MMGVLAHVRRRRQRHWWRRAGNGYTGVVRQAAAHLNAGLWKPGSQGSRQMTSESDYLAYLEEELQLPAGFRVGSTSLKFVPAELPEGHDPLPMKLTLICLDEPTENWAAVFTSNAFPGAPVLVGRERLSEGKPLQAIAVNNKVSNVFPADGGQASSEAVCKAVAEHLDFSGGGHSVLPCSTGVIGWRLPVDELVAAVPAAAKTLQSESALPAASGICTTDRYPKGSSAELPGGARIVGFAKGAGMVEPNMATMLCYILTDAAVECNQRELQALLREAVGDSFNSVSVDGDESTSDTVALVASGRGAAVSSGDFKTALRDVCRDLAAEVVRNGEGTQHVMRVAVSGATDDAVARRVARAVANGPLFKTAVAGNDPNVGRLVGKVGQALSRAGAAMADGCVCSIGGEVIFENGRFSLDGEKEVRLHEHLLAAQQDDQLKYPPHQRVVDVEVRLGGGGSGQAVVFGSDLTREYVAINADYRS